MTYTIQQFAKLSGVSVRTLHYYDEIALLKPARVGENGYRYYSEQEVLTLQQILFFRELAFSLETIRNMLMSPNFNKMQAFHDQKKLLEMKQLQIARMIIEIDRSIQALKGGENMSNVTFSAFQDPTYQQYKDEVQQRWGNTVAYKQSMERVGKMSKADFEKVKAEAENIAQNIADLMKRGLSAESVEVQYEIDRFYQHLHNFYDPSYEMFKGLRQMYVDDPRFLKTYEDRVEGLSGFMRDAMAYYADAHLT